MHGLKMIVLALWSLATVTLAAEFAPVGAKATLSVEYHFEAKGKKQGKTELHEWNVQRSADVAADLVAQKAQPVSVMQAPDSAQMAKLQRQQAQTQKMAKQMAPMAAGAEAILARCGDDEKCIEREVMKMGAGLAGTQQLADTQRVGKETAALLQPGADRYQHWQARTQKASYRIDESWHVVHADPICMTLPKARCTHDMTRKGGGEIAPTPSAAQVEFDVQAGTMVLRLPVPHAALAYVETHSTDEPLGTHDTATPKGPQQGLMPLRVTADGGSVPALLTVPLQGGWRSQSGEQALSVSAGGWHGAGGDSGTLRVRWRFVAP